VPGFADIDRDLRASLAVFNYRTPSGQYFDGFAPDIEDFNAVKEASRRTITVPARSHKGCSRHCTTTAVVDAPYSQVLTQFNAGIVEYSRRLRQAVGPSTTLGAIVIDAVINRHQPPTWPDFPWAQIAKNYDVVLPMAYWSVSKPESCPAQDAGPYIRDLVATTEALMGTPRPIHVIGGIGDCLSPLDVSTYVDAAKSSGSIGGGLYSLITIYRNRDQEAFWQALSRFNK
jgi:hypothetical protein